MATREIGSLEFVLGDRHIETIISGRMATIPVSILPTHKWKDADQSQHKFPWWAILILVYFEILSLFLFCIMKRCATTDQPQVAPLPVVEVQMCIKQSKSKGYWIDWVVRVITAEKWSAGVDFFKGIVLVFSWVGG